MTDGVNPSSISPDFVSHVAFSVLRAQKSFPYRGGFAWSADPPVKSQGL